MYKHRSAQKSVRPVLKLYVYFRHGIGQGGTNIPYNYSTPQPSRGYNRDRGGHQKSYSAPQFRSKFIMHYENKMFERGGGAASVLR